MGKQNVPLPRESLVGLVNPFVDKVNACKGMYFGWIFLKEYSRPAAQQMLGFARYMVRVELECARLVLLARLLNIYPHVPDCKKK